MWLLNLQTEEKYLKSLLKSKLWLGKKLTFFFLWRTSYCNRKLMSFRHLLERRFCLTFYFKWKSFVLADHILSETICLFYFCVLFSNIYTKIKLTAKSWSDLCNFNSKGIFWNFYLRKYFSLSFAEFELLMFHNKIVKISEKLNKWN